MAKSSPPRFLLFTIQWAQFALTGSQLLTNNYTERLIQHDYQRLVISEKLGKQQYGGKKGVGTEHLLITMIDRNKNVLDEPEKNMVVICSYD